jgi:hypothetical protein
VGTDVLQAMIGDVGADFSKSVKSAPTVPTKPAPTSPETQAAALLFGAALRYESYAEPILANVPQESLVDPWKTLYTALKVVYHEAQTQPSVPPQTLFSRLRAYLDGQQLERMVHVLDAAALRIDEIFAGLTPTQVRIEVENHLALFASAQLMKRRKDLEAAIRHAEIAGDSSRLTELLAEYSKLISRPAPIHAPRRTNE